VNNAQRVDSGLVFRISKYLDLQETGAWVAGFLQFRWRFGIPLGALA
jgi:hypothetical protein